MRIMRKYAMIWLLILAAVSVTACAVTVPSGTAAVSQVAKYSEAALLPLQSAAGDITLEVREALAGTSFEAKVTRAHVGTDRLLFKYTFEFEGTSYEAGVTVYDDSFGSEEAFLSWFEEEYGSITNSDAETLTFGDLTVNDLVLITYDENGKLAGITVTGHEDMDVLRLLAEGFLVPLVLLAVICVLSRAGSVGRSQKIPVVRMMAIFLLEMAVAFIPVVYAEVWIDQVLSRMFGAGEILYRLASPFGGVALVEESAKFLIVFLLTWRCGKFTQRYDGVIFAAAASMGFSALENVFYFMEFGVGLETFLSRTIFATPVHLSFAIWMGCFYGGAKAAAVRGEKGKSRGLLAAAVLAPVLAHGLYDLFGGAGGILVQSAIWQKVFAAVLYAAAILLLIWCIVKNEPLIRPISVNKEPAPAFCPECGAKLSPQAVFCGNCGRLLQEPRQIP